MSTRIERRNIAWNAFGEGLWGLGMGLGSFVTVLPLLVEGLGGGKLEIGLVGAIGTVCILLPQALGSLVLQHGRGKKRFLVAFHFAVLIPLWIAMGLAALFLGRTSPLAARVLVEVFFAAFMLSIGFILPAWLDWVASFVGPKKRGTLFGWASFASALGGTAAALVAKRMAAAYDFPLGYAAIILMGAAFYCLSMLAFLPVRELAAAPAGPKMTTGEILGRFRASLSEPNFRRYLAARLLLTAGSGPVAFFAVHYKSAEGGSVPGHLVIGMGAVLTVSQAVMALVMGRLGDALGHKLGATLGASAQVAALAVAAFVPGVWSCAAALALTGAGFASAWVSHQNMLFETCPHDCRVAHITVSNLVLAPFVAAVPIATGWAVRALGAQIAFGMCLVPAVLGLAWLLLAVKEPRVVRVT